jgi:hypothetical protein
LCRFSLLAFFDGKIGDLPFPACAGMKRRPWAFELLKGEMPTHFIPALLEFCVEIGLHSEEKKTKCFAEHGKTAEFPL